MKLSDFGERFRGYSGITQLMDDLSEGLAQPGVVMLGGGNPATIPEVVEVFESVIEKLKTSHTAKPTHEGVNYHLCKSCRDGGIKSIPARGQNFRTNIGGARLWADDDTFHGIAPKF